MKSRSINGLNFVAIMALSLPISAYAATGISNPVDSFWVLTLGVLFALLIFFLICRELVCWYWKINQGIALLTEVRDLLKRVPTAAAAITPQEDGTDASGEICPHCHKKDAYYDIYRNLFCPHCQKVIS